MFAVCTVEGTDTSQYEEFAPNTQREQFAFVAGKINPRALLTLEVGAAFDLHSGRGCKLDFVVAPSPNHRRSAMVRVRVQTMPERAIGGAAGFILTIP